MIHIEHSDGRTPSFGSPNYYTADVSEMIRPPVAPRMKEQGHATGRRINPRKVWTLVSIAKVAGQREVFRRITTTVLTRDNMLDVKPDTRSKPLRNAAILALLPGAAPDEVARGGIHQAACCVCKKCRAFAWRMPRK